MPRYYMENVLRFPKSAPLETHREIREGTPGGFSKEAYVRNPG